MQALRQSQIVSFELRRRVAPAETTTAPTLRRRTSRLFFASAADTVSPDEQNGDRSAGARGAADQRRLRGFLGNNDKVFIIYVDQTVGSAITMFMREMSKERPLTHDLMAHLMTALGAHVERVIINDLKNATYYARMIIRAENELQQKKIIELDGRPSDCIAMATQQKAPIYVSQEVWDEVDDMSDVLRKMEEEGLKPDPEAESRRQRKK